MAGVPVSSLADAPSASASASAAVSSWSTAQATLHQTQPPVAITTKRIQQLVEQVAGPDERLDPEVEALLVDLADDFVESVASFACLLARHRQSNTIDVQDVRMFLEKHWHMHVPGLSVGDTSASSMASASVTDTSPLQSSSSISVPPIRRDSLLSVGEAHRRRLQLIAKMRQRKAKRATSNAAAALTVGGSSGSGGVSVHPSSAAAAIAAQQAKKRKRVDEA